MSMCEGQSVSRIEFSKYNRQDFFQVSLTNRHGLFSYTIWKRINKGDVTWLIVICNPLKQGRKLSTRRDALNWLKMMLHKCDLWCDDQVDKDFDELDKLSDGSKAVVNIVDNNKDLYKMLCIEESCNFGDLIYLADGLYMDINGNLVEK